jgi:WD40 repeat protein
MNLHSVSRPTLLAALVFCWSVRHPAVRAGDSPPVTAVPAHYSRLVDISADGRFYACAAGDGRLIFRQTRSHSPLHTFYICEPRAVSLSADGRYLAAAGEVGCSRSAIKVWDTRTGTLLCTFPTEVTGHSLLKFSPDAARLVSTRPGALDVWNLVTKEREASHPETKTIYQLAFRREEITVVSILSDGGNMRVFQLVDAAPGGK